MRHSNKKEDMSEKHAQEIKKVSPHKTDYKHQWVFTLLSIPQIGGLLATIIVFGPASVFSLLFISITSIDDSSVPEWPTILFLVVILSCEFIATWWWLHYLERKVNLAFYFPIPFVKIRIKWALYPFMLPFFGIRKIYLALTNKEITGAEDSSPG